MKLPILALIIHPLLAACKEKPTKLHRNNPFFIVVILLLVCGAHFTSCQQVEENDYELVAVAVDQAGNPLEGIKVMTGKLESVGNANFPMANPVTTEPVLTDVNGNALIKFKSVPEPSGNVTFFQDNFYRSSERVKWLRPDGFNDKSRKGTIKGVIKPIRKPIAMYAHDNSGAMDKIAMITELGKIYSYDLSMSEPLPPLGKGEVADFTFTVDGFHHDNGNYDLKLEVIFKNPKDGVVEFLTPQRAGVREPISSGSFLISGYKTPVNGYQPKLTRRVQRNGIENPRETDADFHRNFYFRTRTVTDAAGNIISAHYGKIYGDFQFDAANKDWGYLCTLALVTTYFNPTPNDRNVEFDPKRNLLPGSNVMRP